MPIFDIVVLSAIGSVFVTFGAVLGWLTWFCRDNRLQKRQGAGHRHPHFPVGSAFMTDD